MKSTSPTIHSRNTEPASPASAIATLEESARQLQEELSAEVRKMLDGWEAKRASYEGEEFIYSVRGREIRVKNHTESLSHSRIPKISLPKFQDWGEIVRWCMQENVPGEFPFTADRKSVV